MMNTVRDTFYSIGDRGSDIARNLGSGTYGLARRVGSGTASLARDIGPRRALIGLAIAAVAVGGTIVMLRYLRARRANERATVDLDSEIDSSDLVRSSGMSNARDLGVRSPL